MIGGAFLLVISIITVMLYVVVTHQWHNSIFELNTWFNVKNDYEGVYIKTFLSGIISLGVLIGLIVSIKIFRGKRMFYVICLLGVFDILIAFQLNAEGTLFDKYEVKEINAKINEIKLMLKT